MNTLVILGILSFVYGVISFFIARFLFRKSILFYVSFGTSAMVFIVAFLMSYAAIQGLTNLYWILPNIFLYFFILFWAINKYVKKPLNKTILKLEEISD